MSRSRFFVLTAVRDLTTDPIPEGALVGSRQGADYIACTHELNAKCDCKHCLASVTQSLDSDLESMSRERLVAEVKQLRAGIRAHRDSTGHDLCWYHPALWGLLPERVEPQIAVPPWPKFIHGCIRYRSSLERELPEAPVADVDFEEGGR